jgi:hypothetical protein
MDASGNEFERVGKALEVRDAPPSFYEAKT